jgi:uncharacterized delta-60 repeat protein
MAGLTALLLYFAVTSLAHGATSGDLDPTFGGTGIVTTDISGPNDRVRALVRRPDGKLVAAGTCLFATDDFCLSRYNDDGTLDTSFGVDGKVTTDISGFRDEANALVLQPDGKLVAAGRCGVFPNDAFCLARYNDDGSLDTSFGVGGKVTTAISGGSDGANALVVQSDGKLVAAGSCGADFCLARYHDDGSLDLAGFGFGTGTVTTTISGAGDTAWALILQPDGKLVAAGRCQFTTADFCLARYNDDGSLDLASFGAGTGTVTTAISGGTDSAFALVLQSDGRLVAAGNCDFATSDFCLTRYNPDGTLDATFGAGGKVSTDIDGDFDAAQALVLQPDGKLVAAGICDFATPNFCLARYNLDGTLDATFGAGGKVSTDISGDFDSAQALVLQPDGKLVAAGYCGDPVDFCLLRYDASATDQITALISRVDAMDLNPGLRRALTAHLAAGLAALDRSNVRVACNTLRAFINQVSGLSGRRIPVSQADELILAAAQIRAVLGCTP